MKKLLLGVGLLISTGIVAQTHFNDDFSSGLGNWTLTDSDGDGFQWSINDYGTAQGDVVTSASWDSGAGALTPDNWMVSDAIDLSGASGTVYLSWKAYAQDQDWADENYSVYVSTNNDIATLTTEGSDFNEVVGTSNGYVGRSIDVSSFVGSIIYVAFRHHNVSDQFRLNIDDVNVANVPNNDLELTSIVVDKGIEGDRTFDITVTNNGLSNVTSFDVDWSFDGGAITTENITGVSLSYANSHTFSVNINGVVAGTAAFNAEITTADDDASNNTLNESFAFALPVPQYQVNDSYGNAFDLHNRLSDGQAIVLDFMASWCGPCESSTPEISEFIENNGSGSGSVEALAITVESTDDASVLNSLNWNGGFYNYPKFPYTQENNAQYFHYGVNHDFNSGGSIPFFVMICPNQADPGRSTIVRNDVGFSAGMFGAYQTALDNCPSATADLIEEINDNIELNVYPNPSNGVANINFSSESASETTVTLTNALGQVVYQENLGVVSGNQNVQLNTSDFNTGIYTVTIASEYAQTNSQLSIID